MLFHFGRAGVLPPGAGFDHVVLPVAVDVAPTETVGEALVVFALGGHDFKRPGLAGVAPIGLGDAQDAVLFGLAFSVLLWRDHLLRAGVEDADRLSGAEKIAERWRLVIHHV